MIGRRTRSLKGASSSISSSERGVCANCDRRICTTSRPMRGTIRPNRIRPKATSSMKVSTNGSTSHLDIYDLLDHEETDQDAHRAGDREQEVRPGEQRQHVLRTGEEQDSGH